jgi:hypothetical protein
VAGRRFRARPICPVFGDHLQLACEGGGDLDQGAGIIEKAASPAFAGPKRPATVRNSSDASAKGVTRFHCAPRNPWVTKAPEASVY